MRKSNLLCSLTIVLALFGSAHKTSAQARVSLPYLESFDENVPDTWTVLDKDGDGEKWGFFKSSPGWESHSGNGMLISYSFFGGWPLEPDNWLISPDVSGATQVRYFYTVNVTHPGEHYAIMASSTGMDMEDFSVVFEETARGSAYGQGLRYDGISPKDGMRPQGPWVERTINLPSDTKYVAVRHYNCTDQNFFQLDDIEFSNGMSPINLNPIQNLTTLTQGHNVTLSWEAPAQKKAVEVLNESFESAELPDGWKLIDADGDGHNWRSAKDIFMVHYHSGEGAFCSDSWISGWSGKPALEPNNYLVTPHITIPTNAKLSYWVSSQDTHPAEHYGVFLSSTGNEESDFTTKLFEETLGSEEETDSNMSKEEIAGRPNTSWQLREVDLSAYAGQEVYLAFRHFDCTDLFRMYLDDVVVSGEETTQSYTYTIYRDNTVIKEALSETTYVDEGVETGSHNYCVEVKYTNGTSPKVCKEVEISDNPLAPVQNLTVSIDKKKVSLSWEAPASLVLHESFDTETLPAGWKLIDGDNDGFAWESTIDVHNTGTHSGKGAMFSRSWVGQAKPDLHPDNYLITPQFTVPEGGALVYWISSQDQWQNEHYGVFLSTTGSETTDFTTKLFDETLGGNKPSKSPIDQKVAGHRPPAEWKQRTIDLSAYVGQEVYLAFRHYESSGIFRLYLDDVTVGPEITYNVYRDNALIAEGLTSTTFEEERPNGTYNYCVEVKYPTGVSPKVCKEAVVNETATYAPVENLTATQADGSMDAVLNWTAPVAPQTVSPASDMAAEGLTTYTYTVYRNGEQIASGLSSTTYRDKDLSIGSYTFGVKVVYPDGESPIVTTDLIITGLADITAEKPYTMTVNGNTIAVNCQGEVSFFDIKGRRLKVENGMTAYTAQTGFYAVRIVVDGQVYVEKVSIK